VFDAALLAVLGRALFAGRLHGRTGGLLLGGVASWLLADFGFLLEADGYVTRWLNVGWMVGACAIAAAVAVPSEGAPVFDNEPRPVRSGRILLSLLPVLLPTGVDLVAHAKGRETRPVLLALATVVLVACAYLRALRLARERDRNQERVAEREHHYRVLAANSSDAVVVTDQHGRMLTDAPQLAAVFGFPELAEPGGDLLALASPTERKRLAATFERLWPNPSARAESEVRLTDGEGRTRWFHLRAVNLRADPAIGGIVVNFSDITARKQAEDELAHRAFHDSLTGLVNRALFSERVEHALQSAGRGSGPAVIYLDVDGFKTANDRLGHAAGDRVLQQVAERLSGAIRHSDTVARLGGDEFAILLENAAHPLEEAITVADRVLQSLTEPFDLGGHAFTLSASLGIAVAGAEASAETLLRDADIAMYRSKAHGKARWTLYDDEMRAAAMEQMELEVDLTVAIERGEFRLEFQPIVRLESEQIVGFEALVRWDHPSRGTIPPATFIPIAESTGAMGPLGEWVLNEACRAAGRWHAAYPELRPSISVNVSARQLADPTIVARVAAALKAGQLDPGSLVLEMTERVLVEFPTIAAERLAQLRRLGVRLAIDDFGTGYSSLGYLRQFPIDVLKLDRSFVGTISDGGQVPAIVRGLLDLGRTLGLKTVAEGIEQHAQLASLRNEHCEYGQGFLFANPLASELADELLERLAGDAARV